MIEAGINSVVGNTPRWMMPRGRTAVLKDLARQRSLILYREAVEAVRRGEKDLARRYVELGLGILRRADAKKPMEYKRGICPNCKLPLIPGLTARVRIRRNRKEVIITKTCLICGYVVRIPCRRKRK
ncbi:MAG TPA: ribonuclease P [Thermoprotei archaeon]|nr:ribonuclease P [Thermoprotei archaeon]